MEWLTSALGIGSAGIAGGLFGIVGGVFNRLFDWLAVKEKIKGDKLRYEHELAVLKIETDRDVVIARETANAQREVAESQALGKSYEADKATFFGASMLDGLPKWARAVVAIAMAAVDFVRGITRPALTIYLCALTTMLYFEVQGVILAGGGQPISREQAYALIVKIIETVMFLTTMAVGWWFATRTKASSLQER